MSVFAVRAAEPQTSLPTNLEVMRSLAQSIAIDVGAGLPADASHRVSVSVLPKETGWYVEGAIVNGLRKSGTMLAVSDSVDYTTEFGISLLQVLYSDIRRDGFFGTKVVTRDVSVELAVKVMDAATGALLRSDVLSRSSRDTIDVGWVERVENPNIAATKGVLPSESFFSNFAEPFILLGSVAVAVYLLFSVRS
jgi:hypothetical protein